MTVKAIYEGGVLKPKEPLPLKEHEEVEIEVRPAAGPAKEPQDPRSFVGFLRAESRGCRSRHQDQYAHLKACLRGLMGLPEWGTPEPAGEARPIQRGLQGRPA